ncbi:hypothetical protein [Geodermatophilus maliterrae]|uniref:Uncharacterized protein n=1 Tax=Geodermatophilus maliterrae TaxID=3162531 RepID=A0ABV3X958_9ACTN
MATSKRLVAAPVVAFGLAFAVVLALGQFLSSPMGGQPRPASGTPQSSSGPTSPAGPTSPGGSASPTGDEPSRTSAGTDTPATAASRSYDLTSLLVVGPAGEDDEDLAELHPRVWHDGEDQVHLCVQVLEGFEVRGDDWESAVGPIHCRTATRGQSLELVLVPS